MLQGKSRLQRRSTVLRLGFQQIHSLALGTEAENNQRAMVPVTKLGRSHLAGVSVPMETSIFQALHFLHGDGSSRLQHA